jgi:hypothetical protein
LPDPGKEDLERIVHNHFSPGESREEMADAADAVSMEEIDAVIAALVKRYEDHQNRGELIATDQLLNAIYLAQAGVDDILQRKQLLDTVFEHLSRSMRR